MGAKPRRRPVPAVEGTEPAIEPAVPAVELAEPAIEAAAPADEPARIDEGWTAAPASVPVAAPRSPVAPVPPIAPVPPVATPKPPVAAFPAAAGPATRRAEKTALLFAVPTLPPAPSAPGRAPEAAPLEPPPLPEPDRVSKPEPAAEDAGRADASPAPPRRHSRDPTVVLSESEIEDLRVEED